MADITTFDFFSDEMVEDFSRRLPSQFTDIYELKNFRNLVEGDVEKNIRTFESDLVNVCSSQSMKTGLKYMFEELTDPSTKTDIIFITLKGEVTIKGFCSVKELDCLPGKKALSIQFVCTNVRGISKTLFGITLFAAKARNYDIVCLQVDNGFKNTDAYCAYLKMGFEYDPLLIEKQCFAKKVTLDKVPMSFDVATSTFDIILTLVKKSRDIDDAMCKLEDTQKQKTLGEMRQEFFSIVQCLSNESCKPGLKSVDKELLRSQLCDYLKSDAGSRDAVLKYVTEHKEMGASFKKFVLAYARRQFTDTYAAAL
jgi:hypothetical protein